MSLEKAGEEHMLDVETLTEGVYLLRVPQSNSVQQIRFVKKNQ
jgi:hypothetical protein